MTKHSHQSNHAVPPAKTCNDGSVNPTSAQVSPLRVKPIALVRWYPKTTMAIVCGLLAVFWFQSGISLSPRGSISDLPVIDLSGADPAVIKVITASRAEFARDPETAESWGRMGKLLLAHDFTLAANVCFERAEEMDPTNPRWPYLLALGIRSSDPDRAFECANRAVERGGSVSSPRLLLSELLMERGDIEDAESLLRQVVKEEPKNPRVRLALGRITLGRSELAESLEHLSISASVTSNLKPVHSLLAQVHSRLGDKQAADKELQIMSTLPDIVDDWSWLDPYRQEVMELRVGLQGMEGTFVRLWRDGRKEEAVLALRETIRQYPTELNPHFKLGDCLNRMGKYAEAEVPLRAAIKLKPDYSPAYFALGFGLHQRGMITEAAEEYREAIRLKPDLAEAHHNLGFCLRHQGRLDDAIESIRTALKYKPHMAQWNRNLGMLLIEAGKRDEALEALKLAQHLAPDDPEVARLLKLAK